MLFTQNIVMRIRKSITLGIIIPLFFACSTTKQTTTAVQRIPAAFDYSPPFREKAGASNITIALVKPTFIGENPEYYVPPFNEMASSMANDFQELLTAKGFTIRGPFGSRDEMVYNDKLNSNFALEVSIDLNPQYNRHYNSSVNWGVLISKSASAFISMTGEVTFGGNLVIKAKSAQYGELIWTKNIALARSTFTYVGSQKWQTVPSMADELKQDNVVYNTLSRELEKFYLLAMNLAWQQIDPQEMKSIADEAKKADKKSN